MVDDEQVRTVVDSVLSIQEMLLEALKSVDIHETSPSVLACHLSKVVCEKHPLFMLKLFGLFVRKFVRSSLGNVANEQLVLLFSCFMWSLCYLDMATTALTLALLHGDCESQTITGKELKNLFKLLYGLQIDKPERLKVFAQRCASEVITFARARADALAVTEAGRRCAQSSPADYVVPNAVFLKFLMKTPKSYIWPICMMQDQWRRFLFGNDFWSCMRKHSTELFENHSCSDSSISTQNCTHAQPTTRSAGLQHIVNRLRLSCIERRSSVPSDESTLRQSLDVRVNVFTVTFRLLQLHGGLHASVDPIVEPCRLSPRTTADLSSPPARARANANRPAPVTVDKSGKSTPEHTHTRVASAGAPSPTLKKLMKSDFAEPKPHLVAMGAMIMAQVEDNLDASLHDSVFSKLSSHHLWDLNPSSNIVHAL